MYTKGYFFFVLLFLTVFLSQAQVGLYPLSQYSVGKQSDVQLRTTSVIQDDTLKIPFIEDFSGPGLPIESMVAVLYEGGPDLVYEITHVKIHGLNSGDNIRVFNASSTNSATSNLLNGSRYVKVIDKYTFQLFDDVALTDPADVVAERIHYFNWIRVGKSIYSNKPDTLSFKDNNGGVYINNEMALNPLSIGVATFDGVNYKGIPYATTAVNGYGDSLTSLPFNLSSYVASDSIYMSFYWQSKSLGDSPLASEFLALEFKNASNIWVQVWKQMGNQVTEDTFKVAMIAITNPIYLHNGFQFRFRSYGILNGRFNVWNLDYIYINKDRKLKEPYLKDVSIIKTNRSALKNYTSVPYHHINNLDITTITSETAQAFMTIRDSLYNFSTIERKHIIRDNLGNNRIRFDSLSEFNEQGYVFTQHFTDTIPGGLMTEPYVLKEEFYFQPLDTIGPIDMSFNNFAAIETFFYDYYSYDDGTPEYAFKSVNPGGIKVANAYKILKKDTLTHIDFGFIRNNGPNMTNTAIFLNVWTDSPIITLANTLCNQQIAVNYSPEINGVVRYALNSPLVLDSDKTYYFGYTQNSVNALFVGYDRNNDHLDKLFFSNDGLNWSPFSNNTSEPGSLIIRPVFSKNEIITSIPNSTLEQNKFNIYPNPAKSELHFTGDPEYIRVYDISGQLLIDKQVGDSEILPTETLANGMYLLVLTKGQYQETKRLFIQK